MVTLSNPGTLHLDSPRDPKADTSRLRISSSQKQETSNDQNGGEVVWLDLVDPRAKAMLTWRLPYDTGTMKPYPIGAQPKNAEPRRIVWAGAHYYAQDQADDTNPTDIHAHWSVETPDAGGALRTRFEVRFGDRTSGVIGADKTIVGTSSADFVVDASNNQVLRIRTGAGAAKYLEYANDETGTLKRWQVGVAPVAETGSNVGSDYEIRRFNDAGVSQGVPFAVKRSNGRVTIGDTDGSSGGLDVNRNSSGNALAVKNTATGGTGYAFTAQDAATSRMAQASVTGESGVRVVHYADGKVEWGDGTNARDTNIFRKAANLVGTDDAVWMGNIVAANVATTAGGGTLFVDAGALKFKGSSGTVTTIAPA